MMYHRGPSHSRRPPSPSPMRQRPQCRLLQCQRRRCQRLPRRLLQIRSRLGHFRAGRRENRRSLRLHRHQHRLRRHQPLRRLHQTRRSPSAPFHRPLRQQAKNLGLTRRPGSTPRRPCSRQATRLCLLRHLRLLQHLQRQHLRLPPRWPVRRPRQRQLLRQPQAHHLLQLLHPVPASCRSASNVHL